MAFAVEKLIYRRVGSINENSTVEIISDTFDTTDILLPPDFVFRSEAVAGIALNLDLVGALVDKILQQQRQIAELEAEKAEIAKLFAAHVLSKTGPKHG